MSPLKAANAANIAEYKLKISRSAAKEINSLDKVVKAKVKIEIDNLAKRPHLGWPFKSAPGLYAIDVEKYRIIYCIEDTRQQLIVVAVGLRKNVYDKLERLTSRYHQPSESPDTFSRPKIGLSSKES